MGTDAPLLFHHNVAKIARAVITTQLWHAAKNGERSEMIFF